MAGVGTKVSGENSLQPQGSLRPVPSWSWTGLLPWASFQGPYSTAPGMPKAEVSTGFFLLPCVHSP